MLKSGSTAGRADYAGNKHDTTNTVASFRSESLNFSESKVLVFSAGIRSDLKWSRSAENMFISDRRKPHKAARNKNESERFSRVIDSATQSRARGGNKGRKMCHGRRISTDRASKIVLMIHFLTPTAEMILLHEKRFEREDQSRHRLCWLDTVYKPSNTAPQASQNLEQLKARWSTLLDGLSGLEWMDKYGTQYRKLLRLRDSNGMQYLSEECAMSAN